jgi:chromosome segregation ATPase
MRYLVLLLLICWQTSHAEPVAKQASGDASAQALRKAQGVVRQLSEEKAALQTELDSEKAAFNQEKTALLTQIQKLEAVIKQLEPLQAQLVAEKTNAESLRTAASALTAQLNAARDNQHAAQQSQQEIIAQAKLIQSDNQKLVAMVKEREQWIKQCGEKNRGLVVAANELAGKYQENRSIWQSLSETEPFTGIGNMDKQNTVENYQFKLEDLKVTPFESDEKPPR